jgi:putative transposase
MARRKRHTPEQINGVLREVEVAVAHGRTVVEVCREQGISEQTYYRWRAEFGGVRVDQAKRLKELERENQRLRKAVADLTLDKLILQETARGPEGQRQQNC